MINKKMILILPYFGSWPKYLDLYLKGCSNNKWLTVLFITNCKTPRNYPPNVKFIKKELHEISSLISERLNIPNYELSSSYKLCDFKPTYGHLFNEHIKNYDYWGFGDIDLIYGSLDSFYFPKIDKDYDVISAREEIVSGSLTFIKNNIYNNLLFKKLENFDLLIKSEAYEGIDETSHVEDMWQGLNKLELPKSSFTYLVAHENNLENIKASFETIICENLLNHELIKFKDGNLCYQKKNIAYFHYVMNKRKPYFTYPSWKQIPNEFYITNTGFYKKFYVKELYGPIKMMITNMVYYLKRSPSYILRKIKGNK
ncbi:hypothetical protein DU508_11425 [Pedobacter chinensis]|uniref:Uncharacterized protein n=1 Tax=Pedobacter chinensis TaxID=2282421 RepID=A0A369PUL5_9SPHI|nr:DUF6625 family protein [Pedobacter chinensis]RDC56214.1 hypothetical protein DU508_11425 [Pedobacter chinensis]